MGCDFADLERFCRDRDLPDISEYRRALILKNARVLFFAEQTDQWWQRFFEAERPVILGGQEWSEAHFATEACTEAAVLALHSMGDLCAQIVNLVVLRGELSEDNVSLGSVVSRLDKVGTAGDVLCALKQLQSLQAFDYVRAFANTVKHACLVNAGFRAEYGESYRNAQGVIFDEFSYKGHQYGRVWACDVFTDYRRQIVSSISNVVQALERYVMQ